MSIPIANITIPKNRNVYVKSKNSIINPASKGPATFPAFLKDPTRPIPAPRWICGILADTNAIVDGNTKAVAIPKNNALENNICILSEIVSIIRDILNKVVPMEVVYMCPIRSLIQPPIGLTIIFTAAWIEKNIPACTIFIPIESA